MKFKNDLNYHISCFKCIYCQSSFYPGDLVRIPKPKVILCLHHNGEDIRTFESCSNIIKDKLSTIPTVKGNFDINSRQDGHTSPVGPMNKIENSMGHTIPEYSVNKITSSIGHTTNANLSLNNQISNSGLFNQLSIISSKTKSPYKRPQAEFSSIDAFNLSYERSGKSAKNIHFGLAVS